jgi:hypothetical protein
MRKLSAVKAFAILRFETGIKGLSENNAFDQV